MRGKEGEGMKKREKKSGKLKTFVNGRNGRREMGRAEKKKKTENVGPVVVKPCWRSVPESLWRLAGGTGIKICICSRDTDFSYHHVICHMMILSINLSSMHHTISYCTVLHIKLKDQLNRGAAHRVFGTASQTQPKPSKTSRKVM